MPGSCVTHSRSLTLNRERCRSSRWQGFNGLLSPLASGNPLRNTHSVAISTVDVEAYDSPFDVSVG